MKKMTKEIKTGIAVAVVLVLFIWGFNFLKGQNIFSSAKRSFYVEYNDIGGLTKSSPVSINGYNVGKVIDIRFINDDPAKQGKLRVQFTVENDVTFSKNSVAKIFSTSVMGGKSLAIIPKYDGHNAESGDYLQGRIEQDLMASLGSKLDPLELKIEAALTNVDKVAQQVNQLLSDEAIGDIQSSFKNLNATLTSLQKASNDIQGVIRNNKQDLDKTFKNVATSTDNLKSLSDSLAKVKVLQISKKLNSTVANLDEITSDIKAGKGTLGLLTKDEALYKNLEGATAELEALLKDVKEHPKRFVHFSLFGKKAKEYESEEK